MGLGIKQTFYFIVEAERLPVYLKLFLVFLGLLFVGIVFFSLINKSKNKLLIIGGGLISGPLILLSLLSILSYFFKGSYGISFLFFLALFLAFLILKQRIHYFKGIVKIKINFTNVVFILILVTYVCLIFLLSRSSPIGGDAATYWGIATSFARGNYPTVLPWQPDYLTVYHSGASMLMGAIHSLSKADIYLTHVCFSFYILSAIFIFITGLAREKTKNISAFLPAIFGLMLFGGPVFGFNGIESLFSSPSFDLFRLSIGSGATSIDGLVYGNFHALGLACFFLLYYLLFFPTKLNRFFKYFIAVFLSCLLLSIDESVFLVLIPILVFSFVSDYKSEKFWKVIFEGLLVSLLFLLLFFLIQNPVRDSLFTPSKLHRFTLLDNSSLEYRGRVLFAGEREFVDDKGLRWILPNSWTLVGSALFLSLIITEKTPFLLSASSLTSLFLSLLVVNTYWSANGMRFINQGSNILMYAFGFLIISLFKKGEVKRLVGVILLLFIFGPQLISDNYAFAKDALFRSNKKNANHYILGYGSKNTMLDWIVKNIPYENRILFVDEYPDSLNYSGLSFLAVQSYGIFVPTIPVDVKILNFDYGAYWHDAVTNLSPDSLLRLKVDYVYVKDIAKNRLKENRLEWLDDKRYFIAVYENPEGVLYKIGPGFNNLLGKDSSFERMLDKVTAYSKVYIDKLSIAELRKGILLSLGERAFLYGPKYHAGYDFFLYIESFPNFQALDETIEEINLNDYDYIIIDPKKNFLIEKNSDFKKIYSLPHVSLYKKQA